MQVGEKELSDERSWGAKALIAVRAVGKSVHRIAQVRNGGKVLSGRAGSQSDENLRDYSGGQWWELAHWLRTACWHLHPLILCTLSVFYSLCLQSVFALYVSIFALYVSAFALYVSVFALYVFTVCVCTLCFHSVCNVCICVYILCLHLCLCSVFTFYMQCLHSVCDVSILYVMFTFVFTFCIFTVCILHIVFTFCVYILCLHCVPTLFFCSGASQGNAQRQSMGARRCRLKAAAAQNPLGKRRKTR